MWNIKLQMWMAARLQIFNTSCNIYQGMWTFTVTRHADCIRLLPGSCMNICHEVWSLSTVMQPHRVYSIQNELLQSCYWKLEINQTHGADLATWLLFLWLWHNTCEVTNCTARRMKEPIFFHDSLKTLPTWDKHVRFCEVVSNSGDR